MTCSRLVGIYLPLIANDDLFCSFMPPPYFKFYSHINTHLLYITQTLLSFHDDLIAGKNDFDPLAVLDSPSVYAISHTWATSFKKYVEKKVNELQSLSPKKCDANSNMSCGGIDILDLSEVMVVEDGQAASDQMKTKAVPI